MVGLTTAVVARDSGQGTGDVRRLREE
ncbi:hypothetical protein SAM23877_0662 [Streptomyces ambofaciens ATCC 23877]|uniref:Uncharacterized protein n=1 Tax=Streptomyces ambofaciens (strain ATCC 23877 / 3486 / DSM 40053 / JCM 4204 / NBRC 12836 / NRRL B-2516) TaxID=278992 RepID=A0A0K2ALC6_STRA7|nr:hypothetical protein SAM23877_0662 [Streptomyces ambofaciens ATCC 23877]